MTDRSPDQPMLNAGSERSCETQPAGRRDSSSALIGAGGVLPSRSPASGDDDAGPFVALPDYVARRRMSMRQVMSVTPVRRRIRRAGSGQGPVGKVAAALGTRSAVSHPRVMGSTHRLPSREAETWASHAPRSFRFAVTVVRAPRLLRPLGSVGQALQARLVAAGAQTVYGTLFKAAGRRGVDTAADTQHIGA